MTEELKQAAQQALMECPFCGSEPHDAHHIEYGRWAVTCRCGAKGASANTGPNATDAAKIKAYSDARTAWNTRALAQRPAAQTEREAFLLWWAGTGMTLFQDTAFAAWKARASLTAPQQATPEWLHLKSYGYAPGNYMSKCLRCGQTPAGLDKRATSCRPCAEAAYADQQATPEPSRGMIGTGAHALANELAQAVVQDDADPDGHDMSAGLFGPNVSAWLRKISADYLPQPATPEPVQLDVVRQAIEERDAMESRYHELAKSMTYKGNSVAWWHSKATAYRNAIDEVWSALKAAGIYADGAKTCADGVRELAATPEPVGEVVQPTTKPYAYEYGQDNGDGTYSVVIDRGSLNQKGPGAYEYGPPQTPHKDWPVKELFLPAAPSQVEQAEPTAWLCVWPGQGTETWHHVYINERDAIDRKRNSGGEIVPLYTTPPASQEQAQQPHVGDINVVESVTSVQQPSGGEVDRG